MTLRCSLAFPSAVLKVLVVLLAAPAFGVAPSQLPFNGSNGPNFAAGNLAGQQPASFPSGADSGVFGSQKPDPALFGGSMSEQPHAPMLFGQPPTAGAIHLLFC